MCIFRERSWIPRYPNDVLCGVDFLVLSNGSVTLWNLVNLFNYVCSVTVVDLNLKYICPCKLFTNVNICVVSIYVLQEFSQLIVLINFESIILKALPCEGRALSIKALLIHRQLACAITMKVTFRKIIQIGCC